MPSHAVLIDNGDGLIYDDVLKITWSQPDAMRTREDANAWAAGLTLGGVSDWRLPDPSGVGCDFVTEVNCHDNEMGYMFFYNLSGTRGQSILLRNL
jgi:hypothetical protein